MISLLFLAWKGYGFVRHGNFSVTYLPVHLFHDAMDAGNLTQAESILECMRIDILANIDVETTEFAPMAANTVFGAAGLYTTNKPDVSKADALCDLLQELLDIDAARNITEEKRNRLSGLNFVLPNDMRQFYAEWMPLFREDVRVRALNVTVGDGDDESSPVVDDIHSLL